MAGGSPVVVDQIYRLPALLVLNTADYAAYLENNKKL